MAKETLKDQIESFASYVNNIPLVIDPCRICNKANNAGNPKSWDDREVCKGCCWFYDSKFEVKK